ncbi:MAG TPA: SpoIID/LytB domain-containing protein [Pyrinomonadaceae bacterium]|jgi:stage II sporulation protein D|nr:SpoIID/LytB domain-containing protein [Pyrinomonadaceae bacterium]
MRPSPYWSRIIALLVAEFLCLSSFAFGQGAQENTQTRPRRVQTTQPQTPASQTTSQTETNAAPAIALNMSRAGEPLIRVGLATGARAATISTNGQLLNASDSNAAPALLAASRVRLEPHLLAPSPTPIADNNCRVELAGLPTRDDALRVSEEIRALTVDECEIAYDATTKNWCLHIGPPRSQSEAEDLRARLEEGGYAHATVINASSIKATEANQKTTPARASSSTGNVRLVSRASVPTRELVAYAATGRSMLFSSRAPVTFASDNEQSAPVRFNDKPYRGRLEVFTNPGGTLTVINVVSLEDYVRGVVPNELSPGGYPALEALKAQAVAARTYAVRNRGNFASQGFDLLPTTRSQVYGGMSTEHPLATRAVEETRGIVATYMGEPINALYTSTCGGRTEDAENIFNEAAPYLRGRECAPEGRAAFVPFIIKTSREPALIQEEQNVSLARDAALLSMQDFKLVQPRLSDAWLDAPATVAEVRGWLAAVARLSRQPAPDMSDDMTRTPAFISALARAVYGESRADTLLDNADVEYLLAFRDAADIPARNRADVALLLRDGSLSLYPDATLRPREQMPRARTLHTIARLLEARGVLQLQKGTTKPATAGALILRSARGQDQPLVMSAEAYLFRAFGDGVSHQMRSLVLVGGEPALFHLNARGEVDYLEVRPAPNGASADRFSPFTNWTNELTVAEVQSRLSRASKGFGPILDLRVAARGSSRRVTDLEIICANGTAHLRGGRIRSIMGLREQLFVIDRRYDASGRVAGFTFTGRGWGHGVGMCQVGAYGMARAGKTYEQILKAYYTGIDLTKLY